MKSSTVISALCWVDRGYAKPILQEYEPTDEEILMHSKLSKKYLKQTGANVMEGDIGKATK